MVSNLIKTNNLLERTRKENIRLNKKSLEVLDESLEGYLDLIIKHTKQYSSITGKKNLNENDMRKILSSINKEKDFFEI